MDQVDSSIDIEKVKTAIAQAKVQKRWVAEIKLYERMAEKWESRGKKIIKRYKDERSTREENVPRFGILWSNVQTLKPALYSRTPKPDIERRFRDKDALGRFSSQVLERAITYFINEEFDLAMKNAVDDRLLPGRGSVWARYEPHFKDVELDDGLEGVADDGEQITDNVESYSPPSLSNKPSSEEDGEVSGDDRDAGEPTQEITGETICWDYVHWQDEGHTFGRTWDEVEARWRKVYLTREKLIKRFGEEKGEKIKLDYSPHDLKDNKQEEIEKKATIYEIWNKTDKQVLWIHKDYLEGPLDQVDDPLNLEGFWPAPRPLFATLANDTCIPVPDYKEYQDQAYELDNLTSRIGAITKAVKVAGVYDASAEGVERLLAEGIENQLVPVKQYAALSEKGGLQGVMDLLPMQEILQTLLGLYEARDKVKQDLYEITGIADIIRGASDPGETYGAQRIKSQFGTMRLSYSQDDVQRFARDLVRIGTQIIAENFSLDTIKKICGVQLMTEQEKELVQFRMQALQQFAQQKQLAAPGQSGGGQPQASPPPQLPPLPSYLQKLDQEDLQELLENPSWEEVYALLKDELMLSYKIDIETDSTIKFDEQQDQQARIEFLTAAGGFLQSAMAVQNPDLEPLMAKMLMFGVRGFKIGKELESAFENAIAKLEKDAQDPNKKKPNPEMAKLQAQSSLDDKKLQQEKELKIMQMQIDEKKAQADSQSEIARLHAQAQVDTNQANLDAQLAREKAQQDSSRELTIARMDNETRIVVAQIQAKAQLENTALSKTNDETGGVTLDGDGKPVKQPGLKDFMSTVIQSLQSAFTGIQNSNQSMAQAHQSLAQAIAKPKQVVRDPATGSIVGVQ